MKNKKALGWEAILAILVVIVTIIIILLFQARLKEIYTNLTSKNICKSSVKAMDVVSIKNIAISSDIKCPLQRIEIKEKNPEQIKREFARLYYNVCDEFGQGSLNLFGKRETTFCVIRDKITFSQKDAIINDFGKYLAEENIPGQQLTYAEFCSGYKTGRAVELFKDQELAQFSEMPIDTNKEYAVIFVYAKGEEEIREIIKFLFGTSESHIAMYIGAGLVTGGGLLVYTGKGAVLGVPLVIAGKAIAGGGLALFSGASLVNYFTNENLKMEWASFFLIREFNEDELKKLPCEYLPAQQY